MKIKNITTINSGLSNHDFIYAWKKLKSLIFNDQGDCNLESWAARC